MFCFDHSLGNWLAAMIQKQKKMAKGLSFKLQYSFWNKEFINAVNSILIPLVLEQIWWAQ